MNFLTLRAFFRNRLSCGIQGRTSCSVSALGRWEMPMERCRWPIRPHVSPTQTRSLTADSSGHLVGPNTATCSQAHGLSRFTGLPSPWWNQVEEEAASLSPTWASPRLRLGFSTSLMLSPLQERFSKQELFMHSKLSIYLSAWLIWNPWKDEMDPGSNVQPRLTGPAGCLLLELNFYVDILFLTSPCCKPVCIWCHPLTCSAVALHTIKNSFF